MHLSQKTPFVVFGDDWGRYPSTIQHTFRHIASRYPVVWINGIGHRLPSLNLRDLKRVGEKLVRLTQPRPAEDEHGEDKLGGSAPAAIIDPVVLPWHNIGPVLEFNTWSLRRAIRKQLVDLDLVEPPVLVTGSPPSVGVVGNLGELASVYYCLDDFLNFPTYTASMLAPLERRLLDRVDMLVATAASLTESKKPKSGRAVHLPQGVNYRHFADPREEPADMAGIPRPRIGFAGSVSTQCDVDLLVRLATEFSGASLVLVGPIGLDDAAMSRLEIGNVHVLGVRPYDNLPAYVQHFDVGIIPYLISAWTVAVDPLKLLEYLAAGIPVVTTAIPEAAKYADIVAVADTSDAFVEAVRDSLSTDPAQEREHRQSSAREHTWEKRAEKFVDLVSSLVAERPR